MDEKQRVSTNITVDFAETFLDVSQQLQNIKIWLHSSRKNSLWKKCLEETLEKLHIIYGYFIEFDPNNDRVTFFIKNRGLDYNNTGFSPIYIPFFERKDEKIECLLEVLAQSEQYFVSQSQSPKIFQHLPIQSKSSDFQLISDPYLNCFIACEIRKKNDYYVVLFDEIAFYQYAYSLKIGRDIFEMYGDQVEDFLIYLLKFAVSIEGKLNGSDLQIFLKLVTIIGKWGTKEENEVRKAIEKYFNENYNTGVWLTKLKAILENIVELFLEDLKRKIQYDSSDCMSDSQLLKYISRFDIEASFEIKGKDEKPIFHDFFVFPVYTQKKQPVFKTHYIQGESVDIHSPILLALYIKTRKHIDGNYDEDETSVKGFQFTKEIMKLFSESIIQDEYLRNVVKKEKKSEAVRAAISQVMARNTAHNIASHVMSNLTDGGVLSGGFKFNWSYTPKNRLTNPENTILHQLAFLNNYIKDRMEYLGDITFGIPTMQANQKLSEIFNELDKVWLLLEHISGLSKFKYSIHFTVDGEELTDKNDITIAVTNDVLGCQALYNIIENVIRNTAKHNQSKVETKFYVNFIDYDDDWYEVEIYDDAPIEDIDKLVKTMNEKINGSVLDEDNKLRNHSLGILEMEACAAYIRRIDIVDIEKDEYNVTYDASKTSRQGKRNILKAFQKEVLIDEKKIYYLAYRIFVSKPKEFLFVGFDTSNIGSNVCRELNKCGIDFITTADFNVELDKGSVFNHQFVFYKDEKPADAYKNQLPVRQIKLSEDSELLDSLKTGKFNEIDEKVWQLWFDKIRGEYEKINVITSYHPCYHKVGNPYNLCYCDHLKDWEERKNEFEKNETHYLEPLSSAAELKLPLRNKYQDLSEYVDQDGIGKNSLIKYKLFEAATAKVLVIDERIQRFAQMKFEGNVLYKHVFAMTNVTIPPDLQLDKDNYNFVFKQQLISYIDNGLSNHLKHVLKFYGLSRLPSMKVKNVKFSLQPIQTQTYQFMLIHFGILERLFKEQPDEMRKKIANWSKQTRIVITSGRGRPREDAMPKDICFVNLSSVLRAFTQTRNKYAINHLLHQARK